MATSFLSRRHSGIFGTLLSQPSSDSGEHREIYVSKDEKGYGFQVSGEYPAHVVKVRQGSNAHKNGLEANDIVLKIDSENVTGMSHDGIVALIRQRESFTMVVQKRNPNAYKHQKIPSQPIAFSQSDDIARIGGYDISCNMINSEYKRLLEFKEQLNDPNIPDVEKAKLKGLINTSQQIIMSLQRKIPENYLKRISIDLSVVNDSPDCATIDNDNSIKNSKMPDSEHDKDSEQFNTPKKAGVVQRRSSVNDRIARTHSIAQDVLANFRSLRKQKLGAGYGSLQSLHRDPFTDNGRSLLRKNTISDSNLNQQDQPDHSTASTTKPLTIETSPTGPPASPLIKSRSNLKHQTDLVPIISFISNPQAVAVFQGLVFDQICSGSNMDTEMLLETVKEIFYLTFLIGLENRKEDEMNKHLSTLLKVFCAETSPIHIKAFSESSAGERSSPERILEHFFTPTCQRSLSGHCDQIFTYFPTLKQQVNSKLKIEIEPELNKLIALIETSKSSVLTDDLKQLLGDCLVTLLKLNKKQYHKTAFQKRTKASYSNLFGKKGHSFNSNKSLKETKSGHMFQIMPSSPHGFPETKCAACSKSISGQSVSRCVTCHAIVHASCAASFALLCMPMTPGTPNGSKQSPSIDDAQAGFIGGGGGVTLSPGKLGSDETDSINSTTTTTTSSSIPLPWSQKSSAANLHYVGGGGGSDTSSQSAEISNRGNFSHPPPAQSGVPATGVKRTVSMKDENAPRIRKPSLSPRNASDPCHLLIDEMSGKVSSNSPNFTDNLSTPDTQSSASHSRTSLDSYIERIDSGVRDQLNVVNFNHPSFTASDNFKTVDQLAPKDVFKSLKKEEKNQQNVLYEFLNSEKKQTYNLKLITTVFEPVLKANSQNAPHHFAAVEKLIDFHFSFYLKILSCITVDMLIKDVGKVFLEVFDCPDYCEKVVEYYGWTKRQTFKSERIKALELENRSKLEKRSLQDLVATEVQRATKYKLLMENVLKHASQCSAEEKETLNHALEVVTKLIAEINVQKGIEDFKFLISNSKLDMSEIEKDPIFRFEIPTGGQPIAANSIDKKSEDFVIDATQIDLMNKPHQAYTVHYALIKYMHKMKPLPVIHNDQVANPASQNDVMPAQQRKIFSNYLIILYSEFLILIDRDPQSEKLTWKRYLDPEKSLYSIIPTKTIFHATVDSTRPLKSDQIALVTKQELNFTCVCSSMQLIVFVSTREETNKWIDLYSALLRDNRRALGIKKPSVREHAASDRIASSEPDNSDPALFNFQSKFNFEAQVSSDEQQYPADDQSIAQDGDSNRISEIDQVSREERMRKIAELRGQVIDLLKQSFDLARTVYDPENSLKRDTLEECFDHVMNEQLLCLVNRDQWLRSFDTPLVSLPGNLDAHGAASINQIEFFISGKENESKVVRSEVTEQDGVAVAEIANKIKVFSDQSRESNEVHLQRPGTEDLILHTSRLDQKIGILSSQLGVDNDSQLNDDSNRDHFFGICEAPENAQNGAETAANVPNGTNTSAGNKYCVNLTDAADFVGETTADGGKGDQNTQELLSLSQTPTDDNSLVEGNTSFSVIHNAASEENSTGLNTSNDAVQATATGKDGDESSEAEYEECNDDFENVNKASNCEKTVDVPTGEQNLTSNLTSESKDVKGEGLIVDGQNRSVDDAAEKNSEYDNIDVAVTE